VVAVNGASKITTEHRARAAVVYVRQSTVMQVREHSESTARQYGLSAVAVELGWTAEQVVIVDADLGVSGRFGSERDGFRELISRVCLGEVGAILGLEVSRLARSSAEFARLLELARLTDTLLIDGDGVYDLGDVNDRLLLGLKGSMSEAELHLLAGRLHGAKLAAAHRGELRAKLTVGFVYDLDGLVVIDPDEQVRTAVEDLFAEFARTGSAYGVVKAFAQTGRLFPQRAYGGAWASQLKWGKLGHYRVLQALKNPAYAGAYTYGRSYDKRRVQPDGTVRSARRKRARDEWTVLIQDHHDGYISWQQFLDNEAKLAANQTNAGARPPREGIALCQGIVYCGAYGARMCPRYGKRHYVFYVCTTARDQAKSDQCRSVAVSTVDDVVGRLLLDAVTPEQIAAALAVADEVTERHVRSHRAAELAVERTRYEADRAERAFSQVEPENRLVARSLEARWETKLAALAEAETALETARAAKPPLPPRSTLEALAADLPRLWDDPDTSPRDRKRLLRTLIADVTLLPTDHQGQVRIGVRWHTGATDEITVNRKGPGRTPVTALEIIRRHGAVRTSEQLAAQLNATGLTTGKGRPWDTAAVARVRNTYGILAPRTMALHEGEVSITQAAAQLGVAPKAVGNWIRKGQLPARRGAAGRWCIPWDEATQELYRQQVASSFRVKRNNPTTARGAV
jgi:DNA invertase Pin-like site-specific DNA recombinase